MRKQIFILSFSAVLLNSQFARGQQVVVDWNAAESRLKQLNQQIDNLKSVVDKFASRVKSNSQFGRRTAEEDVMATVEEIQNQLTRLKTTIQTIHASWPGARRLDGEVEGSYLRFPVEVERAMMMERWAPQPRVRP